MTHCAPVQTTAPRLGTPQRICSSVVPSIGHRNMAAKRLVMPRCSCCAQPCGGAIPLCMVDEFKLPMEIIDRKVTKMKMISPSNREVDVGKTLSEREWIGMCRREVRIRLSDSWGAFLLASVHAC